jgi:NAD(P)-dependent dehydrogenase (short-subunit alcohol dehydrogenase family)
MTNHRREFLKRSAAALALPAVAGCSGADVESDLAVPRSPFDEDSTAEQVTDGIDLSGKIAVVTGCNSGLGFETMRVLALRGAYVVGTARSMEKADAACSSVIGVTTPVELELSDFDSVVACAEAIRSLNSPIDMLVCNAGMQGGELERVYNLEKHFVVNHLGHFVFVNRLLDRLFFAWQGRIVVVGSRSAYRNVPDAGIEFDNLDGARDYRANRAYAQSKLANILFSLELGRLLKGTRITSNSLHPGVIGTGILRNRSRLRRTMFAAAARVYGKSVEQGAATSCHVAASPLLGSTSGRYFEDCNAVTVRGDNHMHDKALATRLWQVSEELTKPYLVTHERPDWNEFENGLRRRNDG